MHATGFHWTIRQDSNHWVWRLYASGDDAVLVSGEAPSRALAAAFVIKAIAEGMIAPEHAQSLAA